MIITNKENKMNYFDIQNHFLTITPQKNDIEKIIKGINSYITEENCEKLSVDISALNMIDALKISAMCSSSHFIKYPFGNLQWIVKDVQTKSLVKSLALKTVKTTIKKPIIKDFCPIKVQKVAALR